jgi:formate-nitrite transporter family protein
MDAGRGNRYSEQQLRPTLQGAKVGLAPLRKAHMANPQEQLKKTDGKLVVETTAEQEPHKTASTVLKQELKQSIKEVRRPARGLLISGLSAGLELGFGVLLIGVILTLDKGSLPPVVRDLLTAGAYAVGFIFVILGNSELFTEHTSLAVFPVLNRDVSLAELLRLWLLVWVANMVGAAVIALTIAYVGPGLGVIEPSVFGAVGRQLVNHPWHMILLSAVLAGWLMGLVSWLVTTARETIAQIALIALVTGTIGFAHLHHVVAGAIEVLAAVFAGQGLTWAHFVYFLVWSTLGNALGGVLMVAVVKYGHISQEGEAPEHVELRS